MGDREKLMITGCGTVLVFFPRPLRLLYFGALFQVGSLTYGFAKSSSESDRDYFSYSSFSEGVTVTVTGT